MNRYISKGRVMPSKPVSGSDVWITPQEFAEEFHVSRTSAYNVFKRLETRTKVGRLVRARRSEVEEKLELYGRI